MGQVLSWLWPGWGEGGEDQVDFKYENLKLTPVATQAELFSLAGGDSVVRAGSTRNLEERRRDYVYDRRKGYVGTMYYAKTTNMRTAEDKLLALRTYRDNVHTVSNQAPREGYIYAIKIS